MEQKKMKRVLFGLCLVLFSILLLLEVLIFVSTGLSLETCAKLMIGTAILSLIGFSMVYLNLPDDKA